MQANSIMKRGRATVVVRRFHLSKFDNVLMHCISKMDHIYIISFGHGIFTTDDIGLSSIIADMCSYLK
jgi:hypothetical protein